MAVERFESRGGRFVRGWGALAGERRVVVGEREFEAECAVVLDVGAKAFIPAVPGLDGVSYWTNRDAVEATEVPASLIVLGGGPVGLELGQVFARLGSKVSIVEEASQLLPREEPESGALIADVLAAEGIDLYVAKHAVAVSEDHSKVTVELSTGETLVADRLLVATGHKADLGALGVGSVGLDEHAQAIPIDEMCLAAPGLWALGSITGVGNSTHVSMYQAEIVAAAILGHETTGADYRAVPRVTFTDPEIASVGLGEAAARSAGLNVRVGHAGLSSSARGWIQKVDNAGFIKLIQDADRSVLVGATSVGPCGGEVLSMLTLAVHGSIPTQVLKTMMYAYPTFHRAVEVALRDL
jgi:pyruvate/2-oxoglutarate dehydrogenase complex dihydrolipoamide dehydrogenase (E3) component